MITKEKFYNQKEKDYHLSDPECILRYQRALDLISLAPDSRILDIGCKYATLKDLLEENNLQVDYYGVDISNKVFSKIKNFNHEKFFVADVSKNLPFESERFDYIFAMEIMEHVESPTIMLNEINRVLKKNGTLILSVPNVYCWNEIIGNLLKLPDTEGHISAFTYQIMWRLLDFTGFRIEEIKGTYFRIPFSKRLLRNRYALVKTSNIWLARSFIYKIKKCLI